MANNSTIQILRSYANTKPTFLYDGQLAYSFVNDTLYIGNTAQQVRAIGGNTFVATAIGAFAKANTASALAQLAYDTANAAGTSATVNAAFLQANSSYRHANSAFANANAAYVLAQGAYNAANNAAVAQIAFTHANAAFDKANTAQAGVLELSDIEAYQNTYIASVQTFAAAAYNQANGAFANTGGTIAGSLNVANNLTVSGNFTVLGNVFQISTTDVFLNDSLIFLANNNISDAVDIGVIGQYNTGVANATSGIFRDPTTKDWLVFQGYTARISSNNLINTAHASFSYANVAASIFKGNLIASTATVGGINVQPYMVAAFGAANTASNTATAAGVYANGAFRQANAAFTTANTVVSASTYANGAFIQANNAITNALAASTYANAAFLAANNAVDTWVRGAANSAGSYANSAFLQANNAYTSANNNSVLAQVAFDVGNNALTVAQNAFIQANAAFAQANTGGTGGYATDNVARSYANSAYTQANTAAENALSAGVYANGAQALANTADAKALSGGLYANAAFIHANAAFLASNAVSGNVTTTGSYANNAFVQANLSYTKANSSAIYANGAFAQANAAFLVANTVGNSSQGAFDKANSANVLAQGAYNVANSATTLAQGAYNTANNVSGSIVELSNIEAYQNTFITNVETFAGGAYDKANSAGLYANGAFVQANASFEVANNALPKSGGTVTGPVILQGQVTIQANTYAGHMLPTANIAYDLGSPTRRWRKLYIAGNTIDLGGASISAGDGGISLTSDTGAAFTVSGTSGSAVGFFDFVQANSNASSTSTSTGSIVVAGGMGVAGNVNLGGTLQANLISGGMF